MHRNSFKLQYQMLFELLQYLFVVNWDQSHLLWQSGTLSN